MLPVGVVLCMLCQYWISLPLAAIIITCLLQGVAGVLQRLLFIIPAGLVGANRDSGASCPYWWLHYTIHPRHVLWVCSLTILRAALFWWCCPAEGNQGLPEQGEMWCYRLGSGSYSRSAAWQMTLRYFAKGPCKAHWWCICRGAQESIWYQCEKPPQICTEPPQPWTL